MHLHASHKTCGELSAACVLFAEFTGCCVFTSSLKQAQAIWAKNICFTKQQEMTAF